LSLRVLTRCADENIPLTPLFVIGNPTHDNPAQEHTGAKFMKTKTTRSIQLLIFAASVVALMGIRFLEPNIGRAQTTQDPATQTAKPFDQAAALENLRKTIAGQENKPS